MFFSLILNPQTNSNFYFIFTIETKILCFKYSDNSYRSGRECAANKTETMCQISSFNKNWVLYSQRLSGWVYEQEPRIKGYLREVWWPKTKLWGWMQGMQLLWFLASYSLMSLLELFTNTYSYHIYNQSIIRNKNICFEFVA